jgi:hypothetical protein
VGFLL